MRGGLVWLALAACRDSEEAPVTFSDPLLGAIATFDGEQALFAEQLIALEAQLYQSMQTESSDVVKRSVIPPSLSNEDIDHLQPRPDRDVADALGMSITHGSPYEIDAHGQIPVVPDQRPLEPTSPDHFDREFLAGEDCWADRSCLWLNTYQELTKVYDLGIVPPMTYAFYKDFRWVNLAGEAEDPRWMIAARSWNPEEYASENEKNFLYQSFTLELWYPRDGRGFGWDEAPEGDYGDSSGGGTLRFLVLWTEQDFAIASGEDTVLGTIRWGMDRNMSAHDDWLEENE
jgi:hypothetical protein